MESIKIEGLQRLEARVTELEFQLAHQQKLYEELNQVVTDHTQLLLRYQRLVQTLDDQIKVLRERQKEAFDPRAEKPPHY